MRFKKRYIHEYWAIDNSYGQTIVDAIIEKACLDALEISEQLYCQMLGWA